MKKLANWLRKHKMGAKIWVRDLVAQIARGTGSLTMTGTLRARKFHTDGSLDMDYGIVSIKQVSKVFVQHLVDTLQSADSTFSDYRYHETGEGEMVESDEDTALQAPTGEAQVEGTQIEGSAANIYRSVATITYAGSYLISEHGLFNAAGKLLDRSVLDISVQVAAGQSIEFTYDLTCESGG